MRNPREIVVFVATMFPPHDALPRTRRNKLCHTKGTGTTAYSHCEKDDLMMNTNQNTIPSIVETSHVNMPKLLSAKEVAHTLNISQRQVYDEMREGRLPVIRIGTRVLFAPSDIRRYITARRISKRRVTQ